MNEKMLLVISIIAIVGFVSLFFTDVSTRPNIDGIPMRQGYRNIPLTNLFMSPILLIIGIVPLSYYFMSKGLDNKLEKNMKLISKLIGRNKSNPVKINDKKDIVLKLLNHNERLAVQKLIEKKGTALQSDISRMNKMNKLKTHRAIRNLKMKGIVETIDIGKTNRITLVKDIRNVLL